MARSHSFATGLINVYRELIVFLVKMTAAALVVFGFAALIALPLWYLAIHARRLFTVLLLVFLAVWLVSRLLLRSKLKVNRRGSKRLSRERLLGGLMTLVLILSGFVLFLAGARLPALILFLSSAGPLILFLRGSGR